MDCGMNCPEMTDSFVSSELRSGSGLSVRILTSPSGGIMPMFPLPLSGIRVKTATAATAAAADTAAEVIHLMAAFRLSVSILP